jgi:hypothetical protein
VWAGALTPAAHPANTGVSFRPHGSTMEVLQMRRRANSRVHSWLLVAAVLLAGGNCTGDKAQPMLFTPPQPAAFSVHVAYCKADAPGPPVPGTHVQITSGPTRLEGITDENGNADFGLIAPGAYEVAVSRATGPMDPMCIDGGDINELIQAMAGSRALGNCSVEAADVFQDGDVTALDLQTLRRYMIFDFAAGGHTGEWRFFDVAPRIDVHGATSLDIAAVLLGDVDLSWPFRGNSAGTEPQLALVRR